MTKKTEKQLKNKYNIKSIPLGVTKVKKGDTIIVINKKRLLIRTTRYADNPSGDN
jgi:hypothetical protein